MHDATQAIVTLRNTRPFAMAVALSLVASVQGQSGQRSVKAVALELAQSGVRTGAILTLSEFLKIETEDANPGNVSAAHPPRLSVEESLARLHRDQPDFLVQRSATSATFTRQSAPTEVLEKLYRPGTTTAREQISVSAALIEVVGSLINRSAISGLMGSGAMPGPNCPLGAAVRVAAGQSTPIGVLDGLVAQVPGLSWFVLYDADRVDQPIHLGLWCPDGMYFRVQLPR